jgi:hypothetical protein
MDASRYSKQNYHELCASGVLNDNRLHVWRRFQQHGPCTTRRVAQAVGVEVHTMRPRCTELFQLGLLVEVPAEPGAKEGIYRALSEDEAINFLATPREPIHSQTELPV